MTQPIFLIGPRGCGKTTVGHALARARHFQFSDTDHRLQAHEQRTVAEIVQAEGWAGAALGTIGIASYAGAGLGEFLTGIIIDKTAILENGKTLYDFSTLALFWVGTGLGSALLCFTTAAIVARRHAVERQTSFSS